MVRLALLPLLLLACDDPKPRFEVEPDAGEGPDGRVDAAPDAVADSAVAPMDAAPRDVVAFDDGWDRAFPDPAPDAPAFDEGVPDAVGVGPRRLAPHEEAIPHRGNVRPHQEFGVAIARSDVEMVDALVERHVEAGLGLCRCARSERSAAEDRHTALMFGPPEPSRQHGGDVS